MPLDIRNRAKW
jgi:hypothetical protein